MKRIAVVLAALSGAACLGANELPDDSLMKDVRTLAADDMQGRAVGTPGSEMARRYLVGRMRQIGLEPVKSGYEHPFQGADRRGRPLRGVNLVGQIPGTSGSDRILLVTAHYDHVGVKDGQIHNGADDNASGVAAALAIAEAFKRNPPKHTVVFAFWDAEESGLAGAKAFVAEPAFPLSRVVLNLNFDMVARGDKGELYVAGAHHYPFLRARLERLAKTAPVTLKLGHDGPPWTGSDDWSESSDHGPFHAAGVPFAYFGVEDHPDYHRPTDDVERIPVDFYRRTVGVLTDAARLFDAELDAVAREARRGG